MIWNEKQKTHMQLLLEGAEVRGLLRSKKRLLEGTVGLGGVPKKKFSPQRKTPEQYLESFFSRIANANDAGCRNWTGYQQTDGRGVLIIAYKYYTAPRVMWIIENGEIPDGLEVLHQCDNPPCLTLDHLFLGTQADNVMDCVAKGRARGGEQKGEEVWNSFLTETDVVRIREIHSSGRFTNDAIGRMFNTCGSNICQIVKRNRWKHI